MKAERNETKGQVSKSVLFNRSTYEGLSLSRLCSLHDYLHQQVHEIDEVVGLNTDFLLNNEPNNEVFNNISVTAENAKDAIALQAIMGHVLEEIVARSNPTMQSDAPNIQAAKRVLTLQALGSSFAENSMNFLIEHQKKILNKIVTDRTFMKGIIKEEVMNEELSENIVNVNFRK